MRRGAQWALGVGAALIAMAAVGGARADVRFIDLDECSASCIPSATNDAAGAEGDTAAGITLSRFGGDADDPNSALIFDRKAVPADLAEGLPSALASASVEAPEADGFSPYDFFANVIDVPYAADAPSPTAVSFTPSLTSQLSAFLWASNDFFGPPSGGIASRRGLPLSVDADALTGRLTAGWKMRTPAAPAPSPSAQPAPPSSGAAQPFGQTGDDAGRSAAFSLDGAQSNK